MIEMKCPQCGSSKIAYDVNRSKLSKKAKAEAYRHIEGIAKSESRTDFHATCKECGYKGEIR